MSCLHWREIRDPAPEPNLVSDRADTLDLPVLRAGMSPSDLARAFPGVSARAVRPAMPGWDGWEWSEPMGRYACVHFEHGGAAAGMIRRPWSAGLPLAEADRLVGLSSALSRREIEARLGPGWPIARGLLSLPGTVGGPIVSECRAWSIRDHGRDTGFVLFVTFAGDRTLEVQHPWTRS